MSSRATGKPAPDQPPDAGELAPTVEDYAGDGSTNAEARAESPTEYSPNLALRKALVLKDLGQASSAQEILRQAAGEHPAFTDLFFWQAEIFAAAGDLPAAEAAYRRCLAQGDAPSTFNGVSGVGGFLAWQGLANVFLARGLRAEAVEAVREALRTSPRPEESLPLFARCLQQEHGGAVAAAELERFVHPRDERSFLLMAELLTEIGEHRLARPYGAKIDPKGVFAARLEKLGLQKAEDQAATIGTEQLEPGEPLGPIRFISDAAASGPHSEDSVPGLTSIIILTYNQLAYTQLCLETLKHHTPEPHEIVVVDNGSTDGTVEYLASRPGLRVILNPENLGFARGVNQGLAAAWGESLLLLNNDTILTPGWLRNLQGCLNSLPRVGLVGPRTNNAGSRQVTATAYRSPEELLHFAAAFNRADPSRWFEVDKLVGFCLLLKREVFSAIGGFDERFGLGNYEDDDYCRRAQAAGYRLVVAGDTFVHHFGSVSFTGNGIDYESLLVANRQRFAEKWDVVAPAKGDVPEKLRITYLMDKFTPAGEIHWTSLTRLKDEGHQVEVIAEREFAGHSGESRSSVEDVITSDNIPALDLLIATSWSTALKAYASGQGIPVYWCESNLDERLADDAERPNIEKALRLPMIKIASSQETCGLIVKRFYQDCHLIAPDAPPEATTELFLRLRAELWSGFQLRRECYVPDRVDPVSEGLHRQRYQKASEYISGMRVLDAGCGVGYGTQMLAQAGAAQAIGVDSSPAALAYARAHYPAVKAEYRQMDVTALEFADGTFDVAVAFGILQRAQAGRILSEVCRVLRPGGLVLLSVPNREGITNLGPGIRGINWELGELKALLEDYLLIEVVLGQRVTSSQIRLEEADGSQTVEFLIIGRVRSETRGTEPLPTDKSGGF